MAYKCFFTFHYVGTNSSLIDILEWDQCCNVNIGEIIHLSWIYCRYQQVLHRNLVYLATIADQGQGQNMHNLLPVSTILSHYLAYQIKSVYINNKGKIKYQYIQYLRFRMSLLGPPVPNWLCICVCVCACVYNHMYIYRCFIPFSQHTRVCVYTRAPTHSHSLSLTHSNLITSEMSELFNHQVLYVIIILLHKFT